MDVLSPLAGLHGKHICVFACCAVRASWACPHGLCDDLALCSFVYFRRCDCDKMHQQRNGSQNDSTGSGIYSPANVDTTDNIMLDGCSSLSGAGYICAAAHGAGSSLVGTTQLCIAHAYHLCSCDGHVCSRLVVQLGARWLGWADTAKSQEAGLPDSTDVQYRERSA